MKKFNIMCRVFLGLICAMPVAGALGIFPAPTPDLYNTTQAYDFIVTLMQVKYITNIMAVVFTLAIGLIIANRMAFAALLILPITVNVVGFHLFLDSGLFTAGSIPADIMLVLNLYFLWLHRKQYATLLKK